MTIDEIICLIQNDSQITSRYPTRLVFTESLIAYNDFVERLEEITEKDAIIDIADCCSGGDKYPAKHNLDKRIEAAGESRVVILSASEYLRVATAREMTAQRVLLPIWEMQQRESSKRRIIIPLFSCKELMEKLSFDKDERQADFYFNLEGEAKRYNVMFYSPNFDAIFPKETVGIKMWLKNWRSLLAKNDHVKVITTLFNRIEKSATSVYIDTQCDIFAYLKSSIKSSILEREWGDDAQWAILAGAHKNATELNNTIDGQLNIKEFKPVDIIARWRFMNADEKWLVWLRFRFYNGEGYIAYVFRKAQSYATVEKELQFAIFDIMDEQPAWIGEYRLSMAAIKHESTGKEYFEKLSGIKDKRTRISLLTCNSHDERAYAIEIAGQLLREGVDMQCVASLFRELYPAFFVYLFNNKQLPNLELKNYFAWYMESKIGNVFEQRDDLVKSINLDKYDSRYATINVNQPAEDTFLFWLDGMGIEWLSLFIDVATYFMEDVEVTCDICTSLLPTETEYNEQWKDYLPHAEKKDKLDKLAHNGMPDDNDYFSCIASQIETVVNFAKAAVDKLNKYNIVIISADHGSSRLAAKAFHDIAGITAPKQGVVRAHGRFCEFVEKPEVSLFPTCCEYVINGGKYFCVMNTHDHFAQGGKVIAGETGCGEGHGGNTPEERLVPVIVFKRNKPFPKEPLKKRGLSMNIGGDL